MTTSDQQINTARECTACGAEWFEITSPDIAPMPGGEFTPVSCGEPACSQAVRIGLAFVTTATNDTLLRAMRMKLGENSLLEALLSRIAAIECRNRFLIAHGRPIPPTHPKKDQP